MDSISNLLLTRKPQEPEEFQKIKAYILKHHSVVVKVASIRNSLIITVPSAPLSTIIRMEIPKIQKECDYDQKIMIRIG